MLILLTCCSNAPEVQDRRNSDFSDVKNAILEKNKSKDFIDARNLLSREQIDAANVPVLFVELQSGQNGTLTPYPGKGDGETWLGADGATITLERGS